MTFADRNISIILRKISKFFWQQNFKKFCFRSFYFFCENTYIFCNLKWIFRKIYGKFLLFYKKYLIIMEIKCYLMEKKYSEILLPENSINLQKYF